MAGGIVLSTATGQLVVPDAEMIREAERKNGPIFTDWHQPDVALLFSGEIRGYLEPCGCAGLENQKGGLKRRHTLIKELRQRGWPVVPLDMGGQVRRFGPQANIKWRIAIESLVELGYSGIAFGANGLMLDTNAVLFVLANLDPETNPLVSANVALLGFENGLSSRYRIIRSGGKRIGVTSILGAKYATEMKKLPDVTWLDPVEALNDIVPKLQDEQCDWLVLMVHGDPDEATRLSRKYPQFQVVATTGAYPCARQRIEPCEAVLGKPPRLCTPDGGPRIVLPWIAAVAIGPIGQSVGEGR